MPKAKEPTAGAVSVNGDSLTIERVTVRDPEVAAYVGEHTDADRCAVVERALRVGVVALRNAGTTVNVDFVQKEFERFARRSDESHERAAQELDRALRDHFADGDGKLPRTLEKFLGDRGTLRKFVDDLFDDQRRDSAIGRMRTLLAGYFDGDGAIVARMLDPRRDDSPLHGFRTEVREALSELTERLVRLEASRDARSAERAKGTAKGLDFEDEVEERLGAIAHGCGDVVEAVGTVAGDTARCRKGDFVQTLNPSWTRGLPVRVAIEAKSGSLTLKRILSELDDARTNRGAGIAVAVFAAGCAPAGCAPFTLHGDHVICEIDVDDPADRTLEAVIRLARAFALMASRERSSSVDAAAIERHIDDVRGQLKEVSSIKARLTSIGTMASGIAGSIDGMRNRILGSVAAIEEEVAHSPGAATQAVA